MRKGCVVGRKLKNMGVEKQPLAVGVGEWLNTPFGYYGSKRRLAQRIARILPPHNAWVEVFCGSAAVTLVKTPSPIEVINDIDGQIVNFFKQLRDNSDNLLRAVSLTPYAREEYLSERQHGRRKDVKVSALENARRFLVSAMMTVNGVNGSIHSGFSYSQSYSRSGREARVNRWYALPERLEHLVERLRSVRIENRDARVIIKMFQDRPATLLYLDPPYFTDRRHTYAFDANIESFHRELLMQCRKAKCMILISGYDNELYQKLLQKQHGWLKKKIIVKTRDTSGKDHKRVEVLWANKHFVAAAKRGKVPIRLTAKEKTEVKVNPKR